MQPLVSILIPAYNAQKWIAQTLESCLAQSYKNIEIIVVDDGSRDCTLKAARSFERKNVKVISQPNSGASAARNRAFELAQGEYIQWLDADDLLASNKILEQVNVLLQGGKKTLLSSSWARFRSSPQNATMSPNSLWKNFLPVEFLLEQMAKNIYMPNFAWLASRELLTAAGPWDTRLTLDDDGEYFFRVILASEQVLFVEKAKGFYRMPSPGNQSCVIGPGKMRSQLLSMQLQIARLRQREDTARVKTAALQYLQNWYDLFYPEQPDVLAEFKALARDLGGELRTPKLSWKYRWIQKLFGWPAARRTQRFYNRCKGKLLNRWQQTQDIPLNPEVENV